MTNIREKAERALCEFIGNGKSFREGQYEAIEATLTNKRTLVVQRTGWGEEYGVFCLYEASAGRGKRHHTDNQPFAFINEKSD